MSSWAVKSPSVATAPMVRAFFIANRGILPYRLIFFNGRLIGVAGVGCIARHQDRDERDKAAATAATGDLVMP